MADRPRRRADLILIAVLLGAALVWLVATRLAVPQTDGAAVVVCQTQDGFYRADALDSVATYTVQTPGTGRGADAQAGENTVRIEHGTVDVTSANCSNQVCVEHDPISQVGEEIVCLHHGMVIEIVASEDDATKLG